MSDERFILEDGRTPPIIWIDPGTAAAIRSLGVYATAVYVYLAECSAIGKLDDLDQDGIATALQVSKPTVNKAIKALRKARLLATKRRPNKPSRYRLLTTGSKYGLLPNPEVNDVYFQSTGSPGNPNTNTGIYIPIGNPGNKESLSTATVENPVYEWVTMTLWGLSSKAVDQSSLKLVNQLYGCIVRAEKEALGVAPTAALSAEVRERLAEELPGLVTYWNSQHDRPLNMPRNPAKFGMLVRQWYGAGKPGIPRTTVLQADPACKDCRGSGTLEREGNVMERCHCVKEVHIAGRSKPAAA